MRVALLGATGFIGGAVLEELLRQGYEVRALARAANRVQPRPHLVVVEGDALDPVVVARVVDGADAVISAVGTPRGKHVEDDYLETLAATLVEAMRKAGVKRLVSVC